MRFHEPSPIDQHFRTPAEDRPKLDLDITRRPDLLPEWLKDSNTNSGVTRWFDLVMGYGIDEALRHETEASAVNAALGAGDLLIHTYFMEANDHEDTHVHPHMPDLSERALYIGAIEAFGTTLVIAGGKPERPKTSMQYVRTSGGYVPYSGIAVRTTRSHMLAIDAITLPKAYVYKPTQLPKRSRSMPKELKAAHYLGQMADEVLKGLEEDRIVARAKVGL